MVPVPNSALVRRLGLCAAAVCVATLAACASAGGSLRVARDAEAVQNYDLAVAEYTKLIRSNPNDKNALQGLERAKLRAVGDGSSNLTSHTL